MNNRLIDSSLNAFNCFNTEPPNYAEAIHIVRPVSTKSKNSTSSHNSNSGKVVNPSCLQKEEECEFAPLYAVFNIPSTIGPLEEELNVSTENIDGSSRM